ncbi:hypothetical protein RFI_37597 [Reticulomyxa filosa]|uniref:Sulfotransferase domain-containing protein n=1 Tax=Reticulomyxa filosa TaxID=46433 RepID=X6LGQ0_RETFI|nr:hypothetical protein RFI_37597 [Reticulomyxa filosa]|eukprot:ETN99869.1 hypothetical protein RFI_37597 [Reticulomyxa filosa]
MCLPLQKFRLWFCHKRLVLSKIVLKFQKMFRYLMSAATASSLLFSLYLITSLKNSDITMESTTEPLSCSPANLYKCLDWSQKGIVGVQEHCHTKNNNTKYQRVLVVGTFHSGIPKMGELLTKYCMLKKKGVNTKKKGVPGQATNKEFVNIAVEWGKHSIPSERLIVEWQHMFPNSLIVVMIRDPLIWIQQMCQSSYSFNYVNKSFLSTLCPTHLAQSTFEEGEFVPFFPSNDEQDLIEGIHDIKMIRYQSLPYYWNNFYESYLTIVGRVKDLRARQRAQEQEMLQKLARTDSDLENDEFWRVHLGRLIVRYEDMVQNPEKTVQKICQCLGGTLTYNHFDKIVLSFEQEARTLSDPTARLASFQTKDLKFLKNTLNKYILKQQITDYLLYVVLSYILHLFEKFCIILFPQLFEKLNVQKKNYLTKQKKLKLIILTNIKKVKIIMVKHYDEFTNRIDVQVLLYVKSMRKMTKHFKVGVITVQNWKKSFQTNGNINIKH